MRVFPISNLDRARRGSTSRARLELPAIYFAHEREVFRRDGMLSAASEFVERYPDEEPFTETVRFRTVGDMSCTGGVRSHAGTLEEVVTEIAATRVSERGETRADDRFSEAAMEDRKRVGYFEQMLDTELLRLVTCGSVDDGKSTLIGRLLYDSKQILADQLEHIEETSERRGDGYVNLALLTDGLRAEREQGITIDVAYRSFFTPRRRFLLADAPGHVQYTRNMVTGTSTAELAIVPSTPQGRGRADQAPHLYRVGPRHPAHRGRGQQDGSRRLRRAPFRRDRAGAGRALRRAWEPTTCARSRSRR